ncbi:hypothetical protein PHYBOEH_008968 [Phytophthora boehmeriae]|uniref:Peptidase S1 domain-containing protein n=1 Tax=Phytophthora boehmeriae TaxID=109152 RepID=A0A8T1W0G6_9STRA|nr:hypothetical protein PHYBOEH_008968 [Phytophthora boehmeriae]
MKLISTFAAAVVLLTSVGFTDAQNHTNNEAAKVYQDTLPRVSVPVGSKTYVTGLRSTEDGPNQCAGTLVSPTHVLTSSRCMTADIRWASVGTHYYNGTQDGERIKVVAMLPHPKFTSRRSNDLMLLELEKPSSFKPLALAAADDSDIKAGEWGTVVGWKLIKGNGTTPSTNAQELQSVDMKILTNEDCSTMLTIDNTMVCVAGHANEDPCQGNIGSPVVVKSSGDGQDVLIGIVSWRTECTLVNSPSVLARVSSARAWIDSVAGSTCSV